MALSVRNRQVEDLARMLAYERGLSITDALLEALEARLRQLGPGNRLGRDLAIMEEAARRVAAIPGVSGADEKDIIGYDENGIPS